MAKMSNNQEPNNKIRNQLIGLATLLLIMAVVAPWILTDKSNSRTPTTPILQPSVVSEQNQNIISDNTNNSLANTNVTAAPDIPYIPDTDEGNDIPNLPDTPVDPEVATPNTSSPPTMTTATKPATSNGKTYMIQLVALKNRQKIEELVALLRLNNYDVKVIPKNPAPDQLIKLQVGPYAKREQADQVVIDLKNLTKLKGDIISN